MANQVVVKDKGLNRILQHLHQLGADAVVVGVLDDALADIAFYNEFGTDKIPERSFIRSTADANQTKYLNTAEALLDGVLRGKVNPRTAAPTIGEMVKRDIKSTIEAGVEPPNAPSTIKSKGSDHPLVDTGALLGGIDYEVRK